MIWVFLAYLAVLVVLGFVAERYAKSLEGYLLGDRQMGPWLTALSYEATAYSGWLMLGFPGRAFKYGLAAIWVGLSCVIGDALNWIVVSRRLREETERLRALTVPEYLEARFAVPGGFAVRLVASVALSVFMLIYLWAQFVAAGKTIMTMLGWGYLPAVVISAAVIVAYTFQGGYRAVIWTDAFQAIMMFLALVILPAACFVHLGGWSGLQAVLERSSREAATVPDLAATSSHLGAWFAGLAGWGLFTFLFEDAGVGAGYLGQPHICVRFMSITGPSHLRAAFVLSIAFAVVVCTGAVMAGVVAHGWFGFALSAGAPTLAASDGRVPIDLATQAHETVLPRLAMTVLPDWLAGLVVSAIMAAIMSTASGFLMSVTSSMSEDVYHRLIRPKAGQRELVLVSRLIALGLGAGALLLSLATDPYDDRSTVYNLVLYGWGGLAGCFSAPVTLALVWNRMTRAGCIAGMAVGAISVFVWRNVPALVDVAYEVVPAMAFSAAAVVVVSLLTRRTASAPSHEPS